MELLPDQGGNFDITRLLKQQNIKHVCMTNDITGPTSVHSSVISRTRMTANMFGLSFFEDDGSRTNLEYQY